jgi:hypothetical protein
LGPGGTGGSGGSFLETEPEEQATSSAAVTIRTDSDNKRLGV